jgi:hypothetical protein
MSGCWLNTAPGELSLPLNQSLALQESAVDQRWNRPCNERMTERPLKKREAAESNKER